MMYSKVIGISLIIISFIACGIPEHKAKKEKKDSISLPEIDKPKSVEEIIGGEIVYNISEIPWQVGLLSSREPNKNNCFCGGSIINEKWILTAAHCFYNEKEDGSFERKNINDIYVFANATILNEEGQVYDVIKIIENANYSHLTKDNDIALIELAIPIDKHYENQIIKIPNEQEYEALYKVGEEVFVSGWGATYEHGINSSSDILMKANVSIKNHAICNENYSIEEDLVTDNMICASGLYSDSCLGDSGGPLFTVIDSKGIQLGITSWGALPCADLNLYGVYTNVFNYRQWINENCLDCIADDLGI